MFQFRYCCCFCHFHCFLSPAQRCPRRTARPPGGPLRAHGHRGPLFKGARVGAAAGDYKKVPASFGDPPRAPFRLLARNRAPAVPFCKGARGGAVTDGVPFWRPGAKVPASEGGPGGRIGQPPRRKGARGGRAKRDNAKGPASERCPRRTCGPAPPRKWRRVGPGKKVPAVVFRRRRGKGPASVENRKGPRVDWPKRCPRWPDGSPPALRACCPPPGVWPAGSP